MCYKTIYLFNLKNQPMVIFTIIGVITVLALIGAGLVQYGKNEQQKQNANSRETTIAVGYHLVAAKKLTDEEDYPNALKAVNEALKLRPNDPQVLAIKVEIMRLLKEEIDRRFNKY
jgi:hypothetical protein